jgi:non-specific protein-tyrosine kinase
MIEKILRKFTGRGRQEVPVVPDQAIGLDVFWDGEWRKTGEEPVTEDRAGAGWVSPVYSQSRQAQINLAAAMGNRCVALGADSPEAEPYRVLRTQIMQRTVERQWNTVMVTSALPGEGKTLTSINLALTFARHFNRTVLLVDCDLRKPSIYQYLGLSGEKGLIDSVLDGKPVDELIVWPGIEKFTVISGGRPMSESAELLGSPRMKEILADIKGRYPDRYVILDAPPILTGADALVFAPMVDAVVVVVQSGKTPADDLRKALEHVPSEKLLGVVLNRQKTSSKRYGYGYYYR